MQFFHFCDSILNDCGTIAIMKDDTLAGKWYIKSLAFENMTEASVHSIKAFNTDELTLTDTALNGWSRYLSRDENVSFPSEADCDQLSGILNYMNDQDALDVFPNPSPGLFSIKVNKINYSKATVKIVDLEGRELYKDVIDSREENVIDLQNCLQDGVYFLIVKSDNFISSHKIIITN